MVPLDADEKAALKNFFETYVVPLLAMILLIWAASEIRDHPDMLTAMTIVGFLAAIPLVIAGSIYAVARVISKGWHDGKH